MISHTKRWWAAPTLLLLGATAWGQVTGGIPDANSREKQNGVSVRDSPEAQKKLDTARNMERQKDWNKAAGWYQEVLEQYRDRVVAAHADSHDEIDQYTSITMTVQEALAHWPAEGLAAYRARYEPVADALLRQARDDDDDVLNKVYQTYFVTEAGKRAGLRLIDLYLEGGDYAAAAWLGDRLLTLYPDLGADRPRALHRTALAYHLAGDEKAAQVLAGQLHDQFPAATGEVFGARVVLSDNLAQQLTAAPPVAEAQAGDSWPMLGGDVSRARVSTAPGLPTAHLYSIALPRYAGTGPNRWSGVPVEAQRVPAASIVVAVDRDELYFQDGLHCYAVSLETGQPLSGWAQTYPDGGCYTPHGANWPSAQQTTVTLTDDDVLAVMGQPMRTRNRYPPVADATDTDAGTHLVCLDRRTGKLKWSVSPRQLKDELASLDFSGSPLVVGGRVYVMARGGANFQFEDCYALCFDLETGLDPRTQQPRWSCFISSSNAPTDSWDEGTGGFAGAASHMAYADGRLYVLSNLGALAAVDAYNGAVVWLSIYPRDVVADSTQGLVRRPWPGRGAPAALEAWESSSVLARKGKLFLLPADARSVFVYDALTGMRLASLALNDFLDPERTEEPGTLLAVVGDNLLLAGEREIWSVRWADYKEGKDDWIDWVSAEMPVPGGDSSRICGMPFVTAESVFVPTVQNLAQLSMDTGLWAPGKYPPDIRLAQNTVAPRTWEDADLEPGNVLVAGQYVIVAGERSVDVYTDLEHARARLEAQVASAGAGAAGVTARLRYAEVMFSAGELDSAAAQLKAASAMLGAPGRGVDAQRNRLFNDAILFAQKLAGYHDMWAWIVDAVRPLSGPFFDIAAATAGEASQQVNYRISRARLAAQSGDTATAVRLYQEVLAHRELRLVTLAQDDPNGGIVQAAVLAEYEIAQLIKSDPALYAPFAAQAKAALETARAAHDPAALLELAQTYPNDAAVAADAMWAAEQDYEAAGKPRLAAQVLRDLAAQPLETAQRSRVLEAMVRNYLALGDHTDVALGRLQKASESQDLAGYHFGRPLRLPNGRTLEHPTFAEAYAALLDAKAQSPAPPLPDFHLPVPPAGDDLVASAVRPEGPQDMIAGVTELVVPPAEMREFASYDRVAAWSDGGLAVYAVGHDKPMYSGRPTQEAPAALAWLADDRLLVWNGKEISLVGMPGAAGNGGDRLWNCQLAALDPIQMVGGPVAGGALATQEIANLNMGNAHVQAAPGEPPGASGLPTPDGGAEQFFLVRPVGDHIIVATSTGRLLSLSTADGRALWQTRLSNHAPDRLLANGDFVALRVSEDNIVELIVLDSADGRLLSRRRFNGESGIAPVNMAFSDDGVLVWTMPDELYAKDLYEPGSTVRFPSDDQARPNPNRAPAPPTYAGCDKPDQLIVSDGRIIAVQASGQFTVRSLRTGEMLRPLLPTLTTPPNSVPDTAIALRMAPPYLYAIGSHLAAYNLDEHQSHDVWGQNLLNGPTIPNIKDVFIGRDYLVLVDVPLVYQSAGGNPPSIVLRMYSRQHLAAQNRESGNHDWDQTVTSPSTIAEWQPVNGGFYYLSGDHVLHFLRGARE